MADVIGTVGDDRLTGTELRDLIEGLAGDDTIFGLGGDDDLRGGIGNDVLAGGEGSDWLRGGDGDDFVQGDAGDDILQDIDSGSDTLDGGAGDDTLSLYRLDQTLFEHSVMIGGEGNDRISSWSYASGDVRIDAGAGRDLVQLWSATNSHLITLGADRDTLDLRHLQTFGFDGSSRVITDFQVGAAGDTILLYEMLSGYGAWDGHTDPFAAGILRLEQRGPDALLQVQLNDRPGVWRDLVLLRDVLTTDLIAENFGGFSPNGVAAAGTTQAGSALSDTLTGGFGRDVIEGAAGSDTIDGQYGDDWLSGGDGADTIRGGHGDDVMLGGAGDDYLDLEHDGGSDIVDAGSGNDTVSVYRNWRGLVEQLSITAGDGNDTLWFQNFDHGTAVADLGIGDDTFRLLGTRMDLAVTLGAGRDLVDLSRHYVGLDDFPPVVFRDFKPGEDRINWADYLSRDLLKWDGVTSPFAAGYLRLEQQDGRSVLFIDRDAGETVYRPEAIFAFEGTARTSFSAADFAGFAPFAVRGDVTGDGRGDLVLRHSDGRVTDWLGVTGGMFVSNHQTALYSVPTEWKIAATADFNGDGKFDILYRNDNGMLTQWLGGLGGQFNWNAAATYSVAATWTVAVSGDFNGDGRADLILRNTDGLLTEWLGRSDGTFQSNDGIATYALPTAWKVAGAGDFNGDGRSDLLLRNDDGTVTEWLGQANGAFLWNAQATYALGTDWKVAGIGDVNGDGRDDVVLHNAAAGLVVDWLGEAGGTFFSNHAATTTALGAGWRIAAVGDYNGDGRADLALRHDSGTVTEWLGTGTGGFNWNSNAVYNLDPSWQIF